MDNRFSTRRQLELMRDLQRAASERHAEEVRIAERRDRGLAEAEGRRDARRRETEGASHLERDRCETDYDSRRTMELSAYESERTLTQEEYRRRSERAEAEAQRVADQAAKEKKETAWQLHTEFETGTKKSGAKLEAAQERLAALRQGVETIAAEAVGLAHVRSVRDASWSFSGDPPPDVADADDAACAAAERALVESIESARNATQAFYDQTLPRWIAGPIPTGAFFGMLSVSLIPAAMALGWDDWRSYAIGVVAAAVAAVASYFPLVPAARRQTREGFASAAEALDDAARRQLDAEAAVAKRADDEAHRLETERDTNLAELNRRIKERVAKSIADRDAELTEIRQHFPAKLSAMRTEHDESLAELDDEHERRVAEFTNRSDAERDTIETDYGEAVEAIEAEAEADWAKMFERWLTAYDDVRAELRDLYSECRRIFPDFAETEYRDWTPPAEPPPAIAFGETEIDLTRVKHGVSEDERLRPPQTRLETPTLMTLDEHPTMLITAEGDGRTASVSLLQAVMLRFLTAMPPGKVRFTILDPVGLGDNFQSFMHLADSDEQLIASRIWSEPRDIDEQLARLTSHMETVLQKYLRSEYETIHEYNAQAGEVAEPFQVLVVAGFPANFSETATRRLTSLVTGGPRCGVYTLIGVDTKSRMPQDFQLDVLKESAAWLDWDLAAGQFVWRYPAFERLPLRVAEPPPTERMIDTIRRAGEAAKAAVKVEVPFEIVEPDEGLWGDSCADELLVPIGRAGANRLQHVRLGKGTSQHLLVAGKTGSGKSTLLHALVTSAALRFSPDEVEFYLVDFKKGVEFKSYATCRLPHARVIAIESEREFGVSVLERLDEELKVRGERFRDAGVQNLADYRAKRPEESTPRILLIIDEFQELFVEDDKLGQEAALLLDRLVRQGRAFGVHVILGTQTLAGAYSLARSTLGQIAVRVALECSEADSHLILSDERNTAARFLSRPGEAIYNDQNGLVTANEPFQVVWLSDHERAAKLDRVDEHRHALELPRPEAIVFEGSAPADPLTNRPLAELLSGEGELRSTPRAWLGSAVAIKPPTSVDLGEHPGANLVVVGPDEPAGLGVLSAAAVALVAARDGARLVVLDGSRDGEASHGAFGRVADAIGDAARVFDHTGVESAMGELATEVARREDAGSSSNPPVFLVVFNASRFRELRRRDDDYGFGGFGGDGDKPKRPDEQFGEVLKNGPSVGVHTLAWCDSYNSLTRLFDRQLLREFALRVALPMSAADSSNLIDTPAAANLKMHRAYLYNDESGRSEKFRPYGPPTAEWLARVAAASNVQASQR